MADTISIDVISLVKIPHVIPIINLEHPAYNVPVTEAELLQLIQFPKYNIYEAGTNKVITGRNIDDYFPHSGGGEGGTTNYVELSNLPSINNTPLLYNTTGSQLSLVNIPATGSVGQVLTDKSLNAAIGKIGKAYTHFEPNGEGQIEIDVNGTLSVIDAINVTNERIEAFTKIKVVKEENNKLFVKPTVK